LELILPGSIPWAGANKNMKMRVIRKVSVALALFAAMACVPDDGPFGVVSSGGRYYIEFSPSPATVDINRLFDIEVQIRAGGAEGEILCDAALKPDLFMSSHGHGMTVVPNVIRREDCTFLVRGMMMEMPGLWTLILDVERGGKIERALFDIDIWQ